MRECKTSIEFLPFFSYNLLTMKRIQYTKNNEEEVISEAIKTLRSGGILIYPTETTYGMGIDPMNNEAVKKLFSYKEKREGKPLSIAVANREMAEKFANINETAKDLYTNFLPGPITVVSEGKHIVSPGVESENGTIGIRIPDFPLILKLIKEYGGPITATSANASYHKRPYTVEDILDNISQRQKDLIDLIIDFGELPHREPSTVVDTTLNSLSVLRQGDVTLTDFDKAITKSVEETQELAQSILAAYKETIGHKSIILALQGDMGAGKTHFTKGIAQYLQIQTLINSPTFTLEKDYPFTREEKNLTLVHIDTWRMMAPEEFEELHLEKHIEDNDIIVIEWAEKATSFIQSYKGKAIIIWIKFSVIDESTRDIIYSDTFIQ